MNKLSDLNLMEISRQRLIGPNAWERIGAVRSRIGVVFWTHPSQHGDTMTTSHWHDVGDRNRTRCGVRIPRRHPFTVTFDTAGGTGECPMCRLKRGGGIR